MTEDSSSLFARLAQKMGYYDKDGQDKKLLSTACRTPKGGTSAQRSASTQRLLSSDSEDDPDKENQGFTGGKYRESLIESSDDDFDHFLSKATPKSKTPSQKSCRPAVKNSPVVVVSSDDDGDDNFETFLQRVKTPKSKPQEKSESGSEDSLKNFIVDDYLSEDDFVEIKSTPKVSTKSRTPAARTPASQPPQRKPPSQWESPVFISDSDDDDDIVMKSTWKTRHTKPQPKTSVFTPLCNKVETPPSPLSSAFVFPAPCPKRNLSEPTKFDDSQSSDEDFLPLLERLKRKNKLLGSTGSPREPRKEPPASTPPVKGFTVPASKSVGETPVFKMPAKPPVLKPVVSQSEPRHGAASRVALCKTPGCFLHTLSNPGTQYGRQFKQNKEELTSRLYKLYNSSVFDNKLPSDMSVTWNNKMRKTAGYCISGRERGGGNHYARIQLSEKVCDSADRLRDTLIHEMCHAATWLINGVQEGHGSFWKLYARKATLAHPELPMVTRCHSYEINYKFQYQCTRCKNTIGRHSKSLDTARFVCALCKGRLELLTPSKPRAPTPFANFVKENYGSVRQELAGQSHADVMRKLSADFASKTKLSQS